MTGTVLLIDYEPRSIDRIRTLLREAGLRTVLARDGASGIEMFDRVRPDLTLVQEVIPKTSGHAVCRALKNTEQGALRAVALITPGSEEHRLRALNTGCDEFIVKPFKDAPFLRAVGRLMAKGAPPTPVVAAEPVETARAEVPAVCHEEERPIPVTFDEDELDAHLDVVLGLVRPSSPAPVPSDARPEVPAETEPDAARQPDDGRATPAAIPTTRSRTTNGARTRRSRENRAVDERSGDRLPWTAENLVVRMTLRRVARRFGLEPSSAVLVVPVACRRPALLCPPCAVGRVYLARYLARFAHATHANGNGNWGHPNHSADLLRLPPLVRSWTPAGRYGDPLATMLGISGVTVPVNGAASGAGVSLSSPHDESPRLVPSDFRDGATRCSLCGANREGSGLTFQHGRRIKGLRC